MLYQANLLAGRPTEKTKSIVLLRLLALTQVKTAIMCSVCIEITKITSLSTKLSSDNVLCLLSVHKLCNRLFVATASLLVRKWGNVSFFCSFVVTHFLILYMSLRYVSRPNWWTMDACLEVYCIDLCDCRPMCVCLFTLPRRQQSWVGWSVTSVCLCVRAVNVKRL